jgi:hypothetical protein
MNRFSYRDSANYFAKQGCKLLGTSTERKTPLPLLQRIKTNAEAAKSSLQIETLRNPATPGEGKVKRVQSQILTDLRGGENSRGMAWQPRTYPAAIYQ